MAIFASTTTSGYSDPLKAYSIKALEQRQKDMLAQAAAQAPDAAMMGTIPGGIGHVLGQVGDRMAQARGDQAIASQKEALARAIAGYDPTSQAPPPDVAALDPEMYKTMMTQFAESRRAAAAQAAAAKEHALTREHGSKESSLTREQQAELARQTREHSSTEAGLTRQQQKEIQAGSQAHASTEAGLTRQQQKELAERSDARITSESALTREQQAALQKERLAAEAANEKAKLDAATATRASDPKRLEAVRSAETDYRKGLSHLENLEEATKILEHPGGIYTGALQSIAPAVSGIPGASMFTDKEKAQRTSRFNTIVGEDAIRDMAETLKGSSTNFEMQKFEKMKNDPNISDADRANQLRRVVKAARTDLEAQGKETQAVGGDTARIDKAMKGESAATGMSEADIASSLANAQAAVASGKWTKEQANAKLKAAGVPKGL